jgi:hypothetical protein
MTAAIEIHIHVLELEAERAIASIEGLTVNSAYMADLQGEIEATARAYVGAAVTEPRRIKVPAKLAGRLDELHVVIHGHDIDGNGKYEGRTTALGAPLEGELPVACGQIHRR